MPRLVLPKNESRPEIAVKTIRKLGSGSYGVVYKIMFNNVPSALKIVKKTSPEETEFLRKEIELIQYLIKNYPGCSADNILCYSDISEDSQNIYFVSDLMKIDLEKFLQSKEYKNMSICRKIDIIWDITKQIINGLKSLHKIGVIHRDIKLPNILINKKDKRYIAKIADFGLSCMIKDCKGVSGTPIYLPPHIILGENVKWTPDVDLYSLGTSIYRMITNKDITTPSELLDYEERKLTPNTALPEYIKKYNQRIKYLQRIKSKLSICNPYTKRKFDKLVVLVKELAKPKYTKEIKIDNLIKFL